MKRSLHTAFLILGLALLGARPGSAEVSADDPEADRTLSPYFFVEGDPAVDRLPLRETKADVRITGVIADVRVTQVYKNEGSRPIHARYVFPASTRAAVHGMTMRVGDQLVRAEIREKQQARKEFEAAKSEGKSAALLEQQRPNVFSMEVANVLPGDEIEVELHYSELLVPTEGTYEFVYPTVVGPRYSGQPEKASPEADKWVKSPYLHAGEAPSYTFDVEARIAAGLPIDEVLCPSHRTFVEWEGKSTARVKLDPAEAGGGNRDYVLRYGSRASRCRRGCCSIPARTAARNSFY